MKKIFLILLAVVFFSCNPTEPFPLQTLAAPQLSHASGSYTGPQNLSVVTDYSDLLDDHTELVQFLYTIDGSNPKTSTTAKNTTGSFTLNTSVTLKIYAYIDSILIKDSEVSEYVYTIQ